ncbi:MAG: 16S rRNA (cytidine(1402)-2'-O)-methyltransferase [Kangiellaceae bacterium]|jgi:16S rRNA (cytidine1402-2'-O)-methyltransferase|nr:16S rRNA (cytidine(1402)-2'-O)-methyltransferase [Kangiellaceae bacterium]|tara:strand:+ start:2335 stop:3180 length:846 start_codon:yes stop_codon:yes gene_type:complete
MNEQIGVLHIVATPIGHLDDITRRALDILQQADYVAAEDTRHSSKLLGHYNINSRLISLHEHNEIEQCQRIINDLEAGKNIALISDAGTPLISDPGYKLVEQALKQGCKVSPIPGPSAIIAALSVAGQPTDRFTFEGFLPAKQGQRRKLLEALVQEPRTMVFYESTHRLVDCLSDIAHTLGVERNMSLVKEITKSFEQIHKGTVQDVMDWLDEDPARCKGEFVLILRGAQVEPDQLDEGAKQLMSLLIEHLPPNKAAAVVAQHYNVRKNVIYQWALSHKDK